MKSKNVKSLSYAKGPKLPLSRNCSIAESTLDWPAASSHICRDLFFFFWLLLETCRPQRGSTATFDSHWVATAFPCMVLMVLLLSHAVNKCLKVRLPGSRCSPNQGPTLIYA